MAPKGRPRGSTREVADWNAACEAVVVARDEIVVRRPRDLRAVAREWKRGSEVHATV